MGRRPARRAEPGLDEPLRDGGVRIGPAGRADVRADECGVRCGRQLLEDGGVFTGEAEERRVPRGQCRRVDEGERAVAGAVQQVGAQGDGATEVVGHDQGFGRFPVDRELAEDTASGDQGDVLPVMVFSDCP
ncbi:hypothetical protein AB0G96_24625 [Streptomyces mobaraensis]